jgi:HAD superfamily hydrolase (TIGR01484 family)
MGRNYLLELNALQETYEWALNVSIDEIYSFVETSINMPLITVGSGGSLTASELACLLHEQHGSMSRSCTPYELITMCKAFNDKSALLLSASGRNVDILAAFKFLALREPRNLMAISMSRGTPLSLLSSKFDYTNFVEYATPMGKDGFLATNSLLAFCTILLRSYGLLTPKKDLLPQSIPAASFLRDKLSDSISEISSKETWSVLYGTWGLPAAIDLESKCTEAALMNVHLADYRNFAHGRHHWLAKNGKKTGVLAIVTPDQKSIADRILSQIPKEVCCARIETDIEGAAGVIGLLLDVFHVINLIGERRGINPGNPRVPPFGRRIYHMNPKLDLKLAGSSILTERESASILRKSRAVSINDLESEQLVYWLDSHKKFTHKLGEASFKAIVLDYDGTLCDPSERFKGPAKEVTAEILRLLRVGIRIGIATGRGKSVGVDLRRVLPKKYWKCVIIGYYNGSEIAPLSDEMCPDRNAKVEGSIKIFTEVLEKIGELKEIANFECRPSQITIVPHSNRLWQRSKDILFELIAKHNFSDIRLIESRHSIDILAPGVSKLNLVNQLKGLLNQDSREFDVLCIGDSGEWPGNDLELLSTEYSLSVDLVSFDPATCWNIAEPGHRGVQATIAYLKNLVVYERGSYCKYKPMRS